MDTSNIWQQNALHHRSQIPKSKKMIFGQLDLRYNTVCDGAIVRGSISGNRYLECFLSHLLIQADIGTHSVYYKNEYRDFPGFYIEYIQTVQKKPPTTLCTLCRTAQGGTPVLKRTVWVCRTSKFETEQVSQFVPIRFSVLIQQVWNPLAICGLWKK